MSSLSGPFSIHFISSSTPALAFVNSRGSCWKISLPACDKATTTTAIMMSRPRAADSVRGKRQRLDSQPTRGSSSTARRRAIATGMTMTDRRIAAQIRPAAAAATTIARQESAAVTRSDHGTALAASRSWSRGSPGRNSIGSSADSAGFSPTCIARRSKISAKRHFIRVLSSLIGHPLSTSASRLPEARRIAEASGPHPALHSPALGDECPEADDGRARQAQQSR